MVKPELLYRALSHCTHASYKSKFYKRREWYRLKVVGLLGVAESQPQPGRRFRLWGRMGTAYCTDFVAFRMIFVVCTTMKSLTPFQASSLVLRHNVFNIFILD